MGYNKFKLRFIRLTNIKEFNEKQKEVINEAMEVGLNDLEIRSFLNPKLSCQQMRCCLYGILNGLSLEQVSVYNDPKYTIDEMQQIRYSFLNKEEQSLTPFLIDKGFNQKQMLEIRKGTVLIPKYVELYAKPCFSDLQMKEIRLGFEQDLKIDDICVYMDARFSAEQMRELRKAIGYGVSIDRLIDIAQPNIPVSSMNLFIYKEKKLLINIRKLEKEERI